MRLQLAGALVLMEPALTHKLKKAFEGASMLPTTDHDARASAVPEELKLEGLAREARG
jgi:hypothetical protein